MANILMLGMVPPPMGSREKIEASNYRTWQFLQPLLQDNHHIHLCADTNAEDITIPSAWDKNLIYHPVSFGKKRWRQLLQSVHDEVNPDCIVAVNYQQGLHVTRLKTKKPIWIDIYGDQLTIMQLNFYRHANNRGLHITVYYMQEILKKGDVFSVCGTPQEHMLVGELAMAERLNSETMGYPFTRVILPGSPPPDTSPPSIKKIRPKLSSLGIDENDFVVLWCGGYNAWTDTDTLFAGLEKAMQADGRIHYVSIGESTYPSPENVYNQFKRNISTSPHKDRYHLLGWLPWSSLNDYYVESNAGINIDGLHYETVYGTRTRLLEMMAKGLPVVSSEGTELSFLLQAKGAALTFQSGDADQFGDHLIRLSGDDSLYRSMAECAYRLADSEFSFYETTAPLRAWVNHPEKAPDRTTKMPDDANVDIQIRARAFLRSLAWRFFDKP
jgi:glycosyltransferase involved in cell wall biosynthesis